MTQTWDPQAYERNGAFVHGLAGGVLEWLNAQRGEYILDLGCGDGQLTQRIAATGAHVWEWMRRRIWWQRRENEESKRSRRMLSCCRFMMGSFDAVFSNAALHWVRDQDAMLAQVHRVLRSGGRFVAEMGGHGNIAAIRVALMAVLERHGYGDREDGVNYYPTAESYTERLKRNGFRVEHMALIPRPTQLAESGMAGWLRTFRRGVLDGLPEDVREAVVNETAAVAGAGVAR